MSEDSVRAGLSRERVGAAALELVGTAGFDQLTLRRLARELGVSAPSLYEHVSSKDELVDQVVAGLLEQAASSWEPPESWDELVRYTVLWWHRVLVEHSAVLESVLRQPLAAPVALDTVQRVIAALTRAGLTVDEAVGAYAELFSFVVGVTALTQTRAQVRQAMQTTQDDDRRRTAHLISVVEASRYPALVRAREPLARLATDEVVLAGLDSLVAGLRTRIEATSIGAARNERHGR